MRHALDGQLRHGHAIFEAGRRAEGLERLRANWSKQNRVQLQGCLCGTGYAYVAEMRRIEAAAEESNAPRPHSVWSQRIHAFMLTRRSASIILTMRYVIAVLAVAGAIVSGLALQVHYSAGTSPCSINEKWDCGVVNHSSYSMVEGIPVALIGILGFLALMWLALAKQRVVVTLVGGAGLAFALYLAHVERDILGVWCLYCVITLGIIAIITLLGLIWLLASASQRRRRRW